MKALWSALVAGLVLGAVAIATVRIDTDARALLGAESDVAAALEGAEGRRLLIAIIAPDPSVRANGVNAAQDFLRTAQGIEPPENPVPLLDLLWRARFELAPPPPGAFEVEALTGELAAARASLTTAADSLVADRLLRDPTGSFRRLVAAFAQSLGKAGAANSDAVVMPVMLEEAPFDAEARRSFDRELTDRVHATGAEIVIVGPRSISARVGEVMRDRSTLVALVGGTLLLAWLAYILRSATRVVGVLLPTLIGLGAGTVAVQVLQGSVHVVALGFGGALLGLAMDYPLHLVTHSGRSAARRVLLGALTTSIAFASLLGSGIPAVGQVGLFVSTGLATAAFVAVALDRSTDSLVFKGSPMSRPQIGWKLPGLAAALVAGALITFALPGPGARELFELPSDIARDIERVGALTDTPPARYQVEASAATLESLLARQRDIGEALDRARTDGLLGGYISLATRLPAPDAEPLPDAEALRPALEAAMAKSALRPEFVETILIEYRAAAARPPTQPKDVAGLRDFLAALGISTDDLGFTAPILLHDVASAEELAQALAPLDATLADRRAGLAAEVERIASRVLACLAFGIALCALLLWLSIRVVREVAEIMLTSLAATATAAGVMAIVGGGLGVFELVALALVMGIGLDYAIFLTLARTREEDVAAVRSVALCAVTTLIAFLTMSILGIGILRDIGMTVSIGVAAAAVAAFARQAAKRNGMP